MAELHKLDKLEWFIVVYLVLLLYYAMFFKDGKVTFPTEQGISVYVYLVLHTRQFKSIVPFCPTYDNASAITYCEQFFGRGAFLPIK